MALPSAGDRPPVLIVGVGSELRSDDAAGRRVAELLVGQHPPDAVELRSVHQLTPELADAMTGRELVVVIDASVEVSRITWTELDPDPVAGEVAGAMSHHLDVVALVDLARLLDQQPAQVRMLAVPAYDLTLGMELSPGTAAAVSDAAVRVREWCRVALGPAPSAEQDPDDARGFRIP